MDLSDTQKASEENLSIIQKASSFDDMLLQLSKEFESDDLKGFKVLCNTKIASGILEACQNTIDLLRQMTKQKLITSQDTSFLRYCLKSIDRNDLEEEVKQWTKRQTQGGKRKTPIGPKPGPSTSIFELSPIQSSDSSTLSEISKKEKSPKKKRNKKNDDRPTRNPKRQKANSESSDYSQDTDFNNTLLKNAFEKVKFYNKKQTNLKNVKEKVISNREQEISEAKKFGNYLKDFLMKEIENKIEKDVKLINITCNNKLKALDEQQNSIETATLDVIECSQKLLECHKGPCLNVTRVGQIQTSQGKLENLLNTNILVDPQVNSYMKYSPGTVIADFTEGNEACRPNSTVFKEGRVEEHEAIACQSVVQNVKWDYNNKIVCQLATYGIYGKKVEKRGAEIRAVITIEGKEEIGNITDNENGIYDIIFTLKKKDIGKKWINITLFGESVKNCPYETSPIPPLPMETVGKNTWDAGSEQRRELRGVAASKGSDIYVGVHNNAEILVFDIDGKLQRSFTLDSPGENKPIVRALAYTKDHHLVIADTLGQQICVYNTEGRLLERFGKGDLRVPTGLAISSDGQRVNVVDMTEGTLKIFSKKEGSPRTMKTIGSCGTKPGQFSDPISVAVNSKDQIIVSDHGNHRVQVFDYKGKYLFKCGKKGHAEEELHYPRGVTVDLYDNIIVCDCNNNRIQMFGPNGFYIGRVDNLDDKIMAPHSIVSVPGDPYKLVVTESDTVRVLSAKP